MTQRAVYSRRRFLYVVGAAASAAVLGVGLAVRRRGKEEPAAARLTALLGDPRAARALGAVWVAANREQSRPADLAGGLLRDLGPGATSADPQVLRRLVAERVHGDYAAGRVGKVDGWVLSETEIRLCALAAVTAPGAGCRPR
jgi:hypothetical protein